MEILYMIGNFAQEPLVMRFLDKISDKNMESLLNNFFD